MLAYIDYYLFTAPIPHPSNVRYRVIVGDKVKQLNIWMLANYKQDDYMVKHLYPTYKDDPLIVYEKKVINGNSIFELIRLYPPYSPNALIATIMNMSYSLKHYELVKLLQQYTTSPISPEAGYYSLSGTIPNKYALEFAVRFHNIAEVEYCLSHQVKYRNFSFGIGDWLLTSYDIDILKLVYTYFAGASGIIATLLVTNKHSCVTYNEDAACLILLHRINNKPLHNNIRCFGNLIGLMSVIEISDEEILHMLEYSSNNLLNIEGPHHIIHRLQVLAVGMGLLPVSIMDDCDMCRKYDDIWNYNIKLC